MLEDDKQELELAGESTECLLTSKDADGSVRSIGPFSRERAEALVQVYGQMYPSQTCWVEPLAKEVLALHTGRVQRQRHQLTVPSGG